VRLKKTIAANPLSFEYLRQKYQLFQPNGITVKRLLLLLGLVVAFGLAWNWLDVIDLKVVGQPSMTGPIQSELEKPFFESLRGKTGIPFKVEYRTIDAIGFKDNRQLALMKDGVFDMVSLRFLQNSEEEPSILGVDPPSLNANYQTARKISAAYAPVLDENLQRRFGVKLLGIWPFGPQVLFCNQAINQLSDLKGHTVRIGSTILAPLIESIGAIPVVIPFDEVANALALKITDCAITSRISGYSAKWPAHTTHVYPIATQMGLNGIAIRLGIWNNLGATQQQRLSDAVNTYIANVWSYSEQLDIQASDCIHGKDNCALGVKYKLVSSPVANDDIHFMRDFALTKSLPTWAERCDQLSPDCSAQWKKIVEPILAQTKQP
jgi:TRAP-type C4-dicarboxylate transport system substrate-binding protein